VLVVWRLDRLGRSLPHLIELLHGLAMASVRFWPFSGTSSANSEHFPKLA
jgi:DNA invertase Pin-like site-specific DNA recombinase